MRIDIRFRNAVCSNHDAPCSDRHAPSPDEVHKYVRWRLMSALDRVAVHVGPITVQLSRDRHAEITCVIAARVTGQRLESTTTDHDVLAAIDGAVQRLAQGAERAVMRARSAWRPRATRARMTAS